MVDSAKTPRNKTHIEMNFVHLTPASFGFNKAFQKYHKAKQETDGEQWPVKVGCIILLGAMQAGKAK